VDRRAIDGRTHGGSLMTPHDLLTYLLLTALGLSLLPAAAFCLLLSVRIVREVAREIGEWLM
jgi:hypothetical protein